MKEHVSLLWVEGREAERRAIGKALRAEPRLQGFATAQSGYEAITKAMLRPPDVLLMSAELETQVSGVYVCKELCASRPDARVILYGEDASDKFINKVFQMGAVNYVVCPCPPEELAGAALDAADGRSAIHHAAAGVLRRSLKQILDLQDNLIYVMNVVIRLTPAELNILKLLYNGMRYAEIAKVLFIETSTMKTHVSHILKKFHLSSMPQVIEVLHSTDLFSLLSNTPPES